MNNASAARFHHRRGMLILLVLGMLTTFMMLGALMLVLATRSRTSARAFSAATTAASSSALQSNALLDEALMILVRGTKAATPPAGLAASESILEDKYGDPIKGQVAAGIAAIPLSSGALDSPILQATLQSLSPAPAHACELNGRVLTLKPDPGDGDVASYRILRTVGSGPSFTCYLARSPFNRAKQLPKNACTAYVNGREFQNAGKTETHDAFAVDKWLSQVALTNSVVSAVPQPSYASSTDNNNVPVVDNDNDGMADGVWLPKKMPSAAADERILPDLPSPLGGTLHFQVSYHVVDLDGRINLNAHGSSTNVNVQATDWTGSPSVNPGLGFGTADIDASLVIADPPGGAVSGTIPANGPVRWQNIVLSGTPAPAQTTPGPDQRRPTPPLGGLEGRYSIDAKPGVSGTNDPASALNDLALQGNSPSDLQSRVKAYLQNGSAVGPTLTFFRPEWTSADTLDDPYELRLDADAPRGTSLRTPSGQTTPPSDNPFTLAELERILRQYDADATSLPQRLATLLDDYAQRSRYTVTTDSWDTPALAGDAMAAVDAAMKRFPAPTSYATVSPPSTAAVYNVLSPDVTAGLRFNVNRPLKSQSNQANDLPPLAKQYLQHLFTLLLALDPGNARSSAQEKAQWAANVVDFRDADSKMTMFAYDDAPFDGWSPDNTKIVFGAERPEVVISETLAYGSTLFVVLHHPWKAVLLDKTANPTDAEPADPSLQGTTPNTLELRKTPSGCNDSVWRLRLNSGGTVRFGDLPLDATTAACMMAPNTTLCVGSSAAGTIPSITVSGFTPNNSTTTVFLERLADPTKKYEDDKTSADYNPYIKVDEALVTVYADAASAQRNVRSSTAGFWRQLFGARAGSTPAAPSGATEWFHWPNRPFISAGELVLVPSGDASAMLQTYNPAAINSLAANPLSLILDAVHVPSRFAGSSVQIGDSNLLSWLAGNEKVATSLLPTWREPGRVNVNTILPNGGNTSNSALDDAVWKALIGGGSVATNPFVSGSSAAATSISKLLSLAADQNPVKPPLAETVAAPRDNNPAFSYATMIRLANTATIRSNVFAVWITLKVNDDSPNAPPDSYRRLFAIVDRSIPTGYAKGENLNARDVIRLKRCLE